MDDTINEDRRVHSTRMDDTINEYMHEEHSDECMDDRTWNNDM